MKVGLLFNANQNKGGVFQYSMSVVNSLKQNNYITELIVYTDNKDLEIENVKIIQIRQHNLLFYLGIFCGLINFFPKILFKSLDLIIAPSYTPLLFLSKSKFIFTLHDLQEIYYPEYFKKEIRIWRNFMYKNLTRLAFKIITESNHVKNDIVRLYKNSQDKVYVIESPPFFKVEVVNESPFKFPYIFFPAQFWKHKNHIRVIKAFKKIKGLNKDIKLVLTGSKSREFKNIYKEVIALNLQDDIIFRGPIPQNQMSTYFSNAKLIIAPTLYESISIPVFEAFKYQVPVCASGVFAIKDQVKNAGILFDPKDIKSIFTSINLALTSDDLRKKCIENGNKRLEYFSHSRFNSLLKQAIDEN